MEGRKKVGSSSSSPSFTSDFRSLEFSSSSGIFGSIFARLPRIWYAMFMFPKQHEELVGIYASQLARHSCIELFVHMMELRLNSSYNFLLWITQKEVLKKLLRGFCQDHGKSKLVSMISYQMLQRGTGCRAFQKLW